MRHRVVHDIHRRSVVPNGRLIAECDTPSPRLLPNAQLPVSRRDINAAGPQHITVTRLPNLDTGNSVQALRQRARESSWHVLNDDNRTGKMLRQPRDDRLQCLRPACR